ncbi:UNVERIFIED_CONTAM: hypothetical protein FKN15_060763 [Acipenser sinensis]
MNWSHCTKDHCFYHGQVRGHTDSWVALSTCIGVRGLIVLNANNSYYLEPMGERDTAGHMIYRTEHLSVRGGTCGHEHSSPQSGSNTMDIAHLINPLHQRFYRALNIRVPLIGLEVWTKGDQCKVSDEPNTTLWSFLQWRQKLKARKRHDNAQLLTGVVFKGTTIGMAPLEGMCSHENSGGINVECTSSCCHANNCTLKAEAQCAHGVCCKGCQLKQAGTMCREPAGSCDLPEYCTGASPYCPSNVYLLDGSSCLHGRAYCHNGMCLTHEQQCVQLWGYGNKEKKMTTAEDARKLRDWILENAGLEAQSLPIAIRILWMMDSERWEAYQREHTPNDLEEGVELVLSYLEAALNETAAQVASPPAEGECLLSPSPPAEGECLLAPSPPAEGECLLSPYPPAEGECLLAPSPPAEGECLLSPYPPAEGECLLAPSPPAEGECLLSPYPPAEGECLLAPSPPAEGECLLSPYPPAEGECLLAPSPPAEGECLLSPYPPAEGECLLVLPPQPKWEEPERPTPEWGEPERPQPKRGESVHPQPKREESVRPQPKEREGGASTALGPKPPQPSWEDCFELGDIQGQQGLVAGLLFAFLVLLPGVLGMFSCWKIKTSPFHKWRARRNQNTRTSRNEVSGQKPKNGHLNPAFHLKTIGLSNKPNNAKKSPHLSREVLPLRPAPGPNGSQPVNIVRPLRTAPTPDIQRNLKEVRPVKLPTTLLKSPGMADKLIPPKKPLPVNPARTTLLVCDRQPRGSPSPPQRPLPLNPSTVLAKRGRNEVLVLLPPVSNKPVGKAAVIPPAKPLKPVPPQK